MSSDPAPGGVPAPPDEATGSVATSASRLRAAAIGTARMAPTAAPRRRRTSGRGRAPGLGAGLTRVPTAPTIDPSSALLTDPEVPEHRRHCGRCGAEVGRGDAGRSEGFCSRCGHPYSFTPKLEPGELVAGQYEVRGALAHGGLGWIHLARDRNVSDRWVVLKGLLNTGDEDALAVAIAEQEFLAQVEHPTIVEIFNFVTHRGDGYTVMEYVGGTSLKQMLQQRRTANGGRYDPFPVDQALAYVLGVLPALSYLHDLGLLYCDLKPDNIIQVRDSVKLIDLGGVRRIDDEESPIYGTIGYQAPEIADVGPSVASDVYTVGRTLLVLTMELRGYQDTFRHRLPPVAAAPLFAEHDSLHWLIARCCAPDPADRFASVEELRGQVLGVLRETVARDADTVATTSATSTHFELPETSRPPTEWSQLPRLRPDTTDPQYTWLSGIGAEAPERQLRHLDAAPASSAEVRLARARAALLLGRTHLARESAERLLAEDPWEWRGVWVQGLAAVQAGDWPAAAAAFNAVHQQLPGELAPKLALALACEHTGQPALAAHFYLTCARTDAAYVAPAAFGLARVRATAGDHGGAAAALELVPQTSRGYPEAGRRRAEALLVAAGNDLRGIDRALRILAGAQADAATRDDFTVRALTAALAALEAGAPPRSDATIGGWPATVRGVRDGLEQALRGLARATQDRPARIELVNRANAVRNWSLT
ncbi:protein kinase [Nocardioides panacisoli]|uniref:serine/threonine-protein kinase n=1 Tax=Nocardioides panacisoli TaxID=627624 RepID=UPI001C62E6EB|nr:serine/threonine-protein kinase [Nocardioides panacisoli]QYJ04483.1 protein kinase [Nocardioides panacisoli]